MDEKNDQIAHRRIVAGPAKSQAIMAETTIRQPHLGFAAQGRADIGHQMSQCSANQVFDKVFTSRNYSCLIYLITRLQSGNWGTQHNKTLMVGATEDGVEEVNVRVRIRMANHYTPTQYSSLSLLEVVCLCIGPYDDGAWEEFVARVGKAISLTILRTASSWGEPSRSLVEDLVQVTYLKLWEDNCRILRDFALQNPDGILRYLKKVAANATHDYFRHSRSQAAGGSQAHVSTSDVDVEASKEVHGSQDRIAFPILLHQIDEHLKEQLTGPDQERDRTIFWLYFGQGMSTKEIGSLPTIGLGPKGVGSVIQRLKRCIREKITGATLQSVDDAEEMKSENPQELVIGLYASPEYGTSIR